MENGAKVQKQTDGSRNPAMDVIRIIACIGVLSIHFFMHTGFYTETIDNGREYVLVIMRSFFMYCVPMFVMLSGYLLCNKKPEWKYYKKIGKTLAIYFFASVFCTYVYPRLYMALQAPLSLPEETFEPCSLGAFIRALLGFRAAEYSWYIEMYLGLFLIVPFLNILYHHLESKNQKKLLLLTWIVLTSVPAILNGFNFSAPGWWRNPTMLTEAGYPYESDQIFPGWWFTSWPITYYFIGCYLREYGLKIKTWLNGLLIVAATLLIGAYNIWRSRGLEYQCGEWTEWYSLFYVVLTALLFAFFMNLRYDRLPAWTVKGLSKLSALCLGIYLVSYAFDHIFYPVLRAKVSIVSLRLEYYFVIVSLVFVCSAVVSYIILKLYELCALIAGAIGKRKEKPVS